MHVNTIFYTTGNVCTLTFHRKKCIIPKTKIEPHLAVIGLGSLPQGP